MSLIIQHLEGFSLFIAGIMTLVPSYFIVFYLLPRLDFSLGNWSQVVFSCACTCGMLLFYDNVANWLLIAFN